MIQRLNALVPNLQPLYLCVQGYYWRVYKVGHGNLTLHYLQ
jgi:hypothetical protein